MPKVQESIDRQHDRLFNARLRKLMDMEDQEFAINEQIAGLESEKDKLGEPGLRADRDFRKQIIMTFRTLWIENALRDFTSLLAQFLQHPVDIDVIIEIFFYRRGIMVETDHCITYWIDSRNLSSTHRVILEDIIRGFNSISLTFRNKRVLVKMDTDP